jgi:alpha-galactosidase
LLARSGTAVFVSAQKEAIGPEQEAALRKAFATAAAGPALGEPLDWMETTCPRQWLLAGEKVEYNWMGAAGASPFSS